MSVPTGKPVNAAVRESGCGTKRTSQPRGAMSVDWAKPEVAGRASNRRITQGPEMLLTSFCPDQDRHCATERYSIVHWIFVGRISL